MEEKRGIKTYKVVMLVILTAFLTFIITTITLYGYFTTTDNGKIALLNTQNSNNEDINSQLTKFRTIIDKYYLGEVDEEKLTQGAIKGYIAGLEDPYTEYISKEDMEEYKNDLMGNFVGIGIYMSKNTNKNMIEVISPIKNSPAQETGIQPGDLIKSVDGTEYTAEDLTTVSSKIKGEEGTSVKLEIIRGTEILNFEIKRKRL